MSDDDDFSFGDEFAAFGDELMGKAYAKGTYEMRVKKVVPKLTSGQKRSFVVTLAFTKGPNRDKEISEQMTWSPESDVAARIFAQGLNIMGASQDWIKTTKPTPQQIADKMTGALVEVVLTEDDYLGQKRNRVRFNKNLGRASSNGGAAAADDLGVVDMGTAADTGAEAEDLGAMDLDGLNEFTPDAATPAEPEGEKVTAGAVPAAPTDDDDGLDWP